MNFFVTAGRGTEPFVAQEIKDKIKTKSVEVCDGKVFWVTDDDLSKVAPSIWSLKSVERAFVGLLHYKGYRLKPGHKGREQLARTVRGISVQRWIAAHIRWQHCTDAHDTITLRDDPECQDGGEAPHKKARLDDPDDPECQHREGAPHKKARLDDPDDPECQHREGAPHKKARVDDPDDPEFPDGGEAPHKKARLDVGHSDDQVTFRVSCKSSGTAARHFHSQDLCRWLASQIKQHTSWIPDPRHPQLEIFVQLNNQGLIIGLPITKKPLSERTYFQHIGLRTPIAYIMARQAHIQSGAVILDPMCGRGTILVEAAKSWPSCHYIGVEIDTGQLSRATENIIRANELPRIQLLEADVRELPLADSSVDAVICDLPFGSNHGDIDDMYDLYPVVLDTCLRVLRIGGRCVLLTSQKLRDFLLRTASPEKVVKSAGNTAAKSELSGFKCDPGGLSDCVQLLSGRADEDKQIHQYTGDNTQKYGEKSPQNVAETRMDVPLEVANVPVKGGDAVQKNSELSQEDDSYSKETVGVSLKASEINPKGDRISPGSGHISQNDVKNDGDVSHELCDKADSPAAASMMKSEQIQSPGYTSLLMESADVHHGKSEVEAADLKVCKPQPISSSCGFSSQTSDSCEDMDGDDRLGYPGSGTGWRVLNSHYVKLGETHAYICTLMKQ